MCFKNLFKKKAKVESKPVQAPVKEAKPAAFKPVGSNTIKPVTKTASAKPAAKNTKAKSKKK